VVAAVVVEVVVARLQHPPVVRVLVGLERVLAEQDAVLEAHEEVARRARLPPDVVEHRADLEYGVGYLARGPADARRVSSVERGR
jgi:hypothetical protein